MSFVKLEQVVKCYQMGDVTIKASDGIDFEIEKVNFKLNNYKKYLIIEFLISIIKM